MVPSILTVSELNRLVRAAIEEQLPLLWVAGEISNLTRAPSGHVYFSLKDAGAQVRCVMFRNRAQLLPWRIENGQQVELNALATLYEARGDYQLNVENMRRAGLGKLYEAFLKLRDRLAAEGLFDADAKRPLPGYPRVIGIATSPRAAALQDILTTLNRRAPHVSIILYPTLVQGESAAAQIAAAIATAGTRGECDALLVARGGGNLEDLWAFNEEIVARAIRACPIPVVAGIGHETDITIADLAADLRAPTPTAAAELITTGWHDAAEQLAMASNALQTAMRHALHMRMQALDLLAHRLVHPAQKLSAARTSLIHLATRLRAARARRYSQLDVQLLRLRMDLAGAKPDTARYRARIERLHGALDALSPQATLERGYSIVRAANGKIVRDAVHLNNGDTLRLRFAHGGGEAIVKQTFPD